MTSIKAAAAVVVVVIIVIAAAAVVLLNNNGNGGGNGGGNYGDSQGDAIGADVVVGDSYTLNTAYTSGSGTLGADSSAQTTYDVQRVSNDSLTVQITSGSSTSIDTMTTNEFLSKVSVVDTAAIGDYLRTEILSTPMGDKECNVYYYRDNAGVVEMTNWVSTGGNVIYQTELTLNAGLVQEEKQITTLMETNMIEQGAVDVPVSPSQPTGDMGIRTQLTEGDYIEFSKYDDDGRETERLTVERIEGNTVWYTENWDHDIERTTVDRFIGMVLYTDGGTQTGTETISTFMGDVQCNVYEMNGFFNMGFDFDWEDRVIVWASVDGNVIYKIESYEDYYENSQWGGVWYDDREAYFLTATSLMTASGGSTPDPQPPVGPQPTPGENMFGVTLTVGDSYTITDERGDEETYEIIAIDGYRLTVRETDRWHTEIERTSADDFLDDILITDSELQNRYTPLNQQEAVSGHQCNLYEERYDDDRETIYVQEADNLNIVWQKSEWREYDRLTALNIASISA